MTAPLVRNDIKKAILGDKRFRDIFPELENEMKKIMSNPNCSCNNGNVDKFFQYKDRLKQYFKNKDISEPVQSAPVRQWQNNWSVINCKADELESVLNKLHKVGRKQISVARYQDDITVVINEPGV